MILPIRLMTTEESFLIFKISIPVWFMFRQGFKPTQTTKDRPFNPRFTFSYGKDVNCLHAYCVGFCLRVRSNKIMKEIRKNNPGNEPRRALFHFGRGWSQVFDSAII